MIVRRGQGFGDYEHTGDWTWEYYPPPYDFLAPADATVVPVPVLYAADYGGGLAGFGDCGCGGSCGGCGGHSQGVGLFDTPTDLSTWGFGEWAIAAIVAYGAISVVADAFKGASVVKKKVRTSRSKARRKAELQKELASL